MSGIQVAQGQERFVKALSDFSEQESINKIDYVTGQNTNGQKRAMDTIINGLAVISSGNPVGSGSTKRIIKKTAHGARKNDVVEFTSGSSIGVSIQILSCPDADTMILAATSEFDISFADTFDIKRYVTPQYNADGSLIVTSTPGPVQYVLDDVDTEVEEDTTTPANNRAFPSKMFMEIDGVTYPVRKDTVDPSNSVMIPVEISGLSGPINITAGDLNVQLSDVGPNFDATRIGDGSGNYIGVNSDDEALVHDQEVIDALAAQLTPIQAIETSIDSIDTKTPALGQALAANSVPVVLTAAQLSTLTPPAAITGFALETTQSAGNVLLGAVNETAPASDTASSGLNGRLQRIAQNISTTNTNFGAQADVTASSDSGTFSFMAFVKRISSFVTLISAKLPATLGPKTPALSLAVVQAVNASGSIVNTTLTATTATSNTPPSNAVGFFIEADSANTDPIRWAIGSTASTTVGNRLEPGRSGDGFVPCVAAVSVCAEVSGTNKYSIQWILSV